MPRPKRLDCRYCGEGGALDRPGCHTRCWNKYQRERNRERNQIDPSKYRLGVDKPAVVRPSAVPSVRVIRTEQTAWTMEQILASGVPVTRLPGVGREERDYGKE